MNDAPDPFAGVVTAADVYARVELVREAVHAVDAKVDLVAGGAHALRADVDDHEQRIRVIEAERWPRQGLTLAVAAAGLLLAALALILKVG